ncbi:MAG: rRNA pseudouridine synthase [Chitinophagales bacterium]|jgi:23S rRNA pseudouridine2605 synthase|nr:rRNA pseudouridine synthase [Chitinophagales bacterium]
MRINKYIAHAGLCSRRNAEILVKDGKVIVNRKVVDMSYEVVEGDIVLVDGQKITLEPKVYILLNKPKGYICTTSDEKDRKTVLSFIQPKLEEVHKTLRIYPVGRLDRNTTGLLLLTNDGELTQKLSHPSKKVEKVYVASLDKPLRLEDLETLAKGFDLEDGFTKFDDISYLESPSKIGVSIHSGKNRIVRRMFEHLGYQVESLDRTLYAHLTKKNLPRGKFRYLTDREIVLLSNLVSEKKAFMPPEAKFTQRKKQSSTEKEFEKPKRSLKSSKKQELLDDWTEKPKKKNRDKRTIAAKMTQNKSKR